MKPIAITQVEWTSFINIFKSVMGESPTRGLDIDGVDIKDPAAFLSCLDFKNQPLAYLTNGYGSNGFNMVDLVCATVCTQGIVNTFINETNLCTRIIKNNVTDNILLIAAGNINQWLTAILSGCTEKQSLQYRSMFNTLYNCLNATRFRQLFLNYNKRNLKDGSFVIA